MNINDKSLIPIITDYNLLKVIDWRFADTQNLSGAVDNTFSISCLVSIKINVTAGSIQFNFNPAISPSLLSGFL